MSASENPSLSSGALSRDASAQATGPSAPAEHPESATESPPSTPLTGDEFADRFEEVGRALWALAASTLGRPDEIEDVLQEAAMIGFARVAQFDRNTSFAAWMGRIVRFVALNRARLKQRRRTESADPIDLDRAIANEAPPTDSLVAGGAGSFDAALQHIDDELFAALGRLRPRPRACLLLRVLGELDYAAIGAVLGIPSGTAMSHVHRARNELQTILSPTHEPSTTRKTP